MWPTLKEEGACVVAGVLDPATCTELNETLTTDAGRGGNRECATHSKVAEIAWSGVGMKLARQVLGSAARPVRILFFDKRPDANWSVPYHQDVTIAVADRQEADGYGPWTIKVGIPHVQPPAAVLEKMIAVRFHLDDCGHANGPLRILPGTHTHGKLTAEQIDHAVANGQERTLTAAQGDAILMRPLVLHASSPATHPAHRRVLHIEYAAVDLPSGLAWHLRSPDIRG